MSVSMENQERDGDKKHKDDDMDKLIKQIINVVPAIIKTKILCSIFEPSLKMKWWYKTSIGSKKVVSVKSSSSVTGDDCHSCGHRLEYLFVRGVAGWTVFL